MVADRRVSKLIRPGRQEVNVVAMSHVLLCTWLADESSCLETAVLLTAVSGDCWQDVASEYSFPSVGQIALQRRGLAVSRG